MDDIKLTAIKSPLDIRDWIAETIFNQDFKIPASFSLVDKLPPVRDQGPYGTCAAFAASTMKEWQENVDIGYSGLMSPQFVYNNRSNKPSEGMYARDVMDILRKKGICPETYYPYTSTAPFTTEVLNVAKKYIIQSYASIVTIDGLKRALIKSGPCYIAFPVYNYGGRFWMAAQGSTFLGGHAVSVVGYNATGFIIRNSWGFSWNDKGYTIFPYSDWGSQWEVWTTVDAESGNPPPKKSNVITRVISRVIQKIKTNFTKIKR